MSDIDSEEDPTTAILKREATAILRSPNHEGLANVLRLLCMEPETTEYKAADALFDFCIDTFPESLTLMLLRVYLGSEDGVTRFQSIFRLSDILQGMTGELCPVTMYELKPLVIQCLRMQETKQSHFKILGSIVSSVAYNVWLDKDTWDELNGCIVWLLQRYFLEGFYVFHYLPPSYGDLINHETLVPKLLDQANRLLMNPTQDGFQYWSFALQIVLKAGVVLLSCSQHTIMKLNLITKAESIVFMSAKHVLEQGMNDFLDRGFDDLNKFLARDANLSEYSETQAEFVKKLGFQIITASGKGKKLAETVSTKMYDLVKKPPHDYKDKRDDFENHWWAHLMHSTPAEIFTILSSTYLGEWSREAAIRALDDVLSHHTSKQDIAVMRQLQPLLISCLNQQGIPHSIFHDLGQVVHHVAYEMMSFHGETWEDLRVYLVSKSQTEFERAAYIFQCLLTPLRDVEFVTSVTDILLPEITKRLDSLTYNWSLAFIGALCAIIHLMNHTETAQEIENNMVESVRKLVESRRGTGIVTKAFGDLEIIVKKHLKWLARNDFYVGLRKRYKETGETEDTVKRLEEINWLGRREYRFLMALFGRLNQIQDMTQESKMVLGRICIVLERGVEEDVIDKGD